MTTHQLAKYLLESTPDLPVFMNGWGSEEGQDWEVSGAFLGDDQKRVLLGHGGIHWETKEFHDWYMRPERLGFDLGPKVAITGGIHDELVAHVAPEDFEETIERIRQQLA